LIKKISFYCEDILKKRTGWESNLAEEAGASGEEKDRVALKERGGKWGSKEILS